GRFCVVHRARLRVGTGRCWRKRRHAWAEQRRDVAWVGRPAGLRRPRAGGRAPGPGGQRSAGGTGAGGASTGGISSGGSGSDAEGGLGGETATGGAAASGGGDRVGGGRGTPALRCAQRRAT